jgi:hypothetical protein
MLDLHLAGIGRKIDAEPLAMHAELEDVGIVRNPQSDFFLGTIILQVGAESGSSDSS